MYGGTIGADWPDVKLDSVIQNTPINFFRNGEYGYNFGSSGIIYSGYYWQAEVFSGTHARSLLFYSTALTPQNYRYKGLGYAIRCLVSLEGLQLPTYSGTKSYQNLLVGVYGMRTGEMNNLYFDTAIQQDSTSLIRSGTYDHNSGGISARNVTGLYWESTPDSAANVRFLFFNHIALYPQNYYSKGSGLTLRCLVPLALPQKGIACYNSSRKGGRVVDGTGLENQQVKASQVRILSLPPNLQPEKVVFCSQLPTYDGTKSYQNLLVEVYGMENVGNRRDSAIQGSPLGFTRSGNYGYTSGEANFREDRGLYWHSVVYSSSYGVNLIFYSSYALLQNAGYKGYGFTLRCLVR